MIRYENSDARQSSLYRESHDEMEMERKDVNQKFLKGGAALGLMLAMAVGAAAAEEHVHTWSAWKAAESGSQHTAVCTECGEEKTTKCTTYSVTLDNQKLSVCTYCGANKYGEFEKVEEATATPIAENPAAQKGEFVVMGKAEPFTELDDSVLYAFTIGYNRDGEAATFKNKSTVQIPVGEGLEAFKLIRVTPSSGDDSTQTAEKWTDIEYTYENGVLSFETKNPALHMLMKAE